MVQATQLGSPRVQLRYWTQADLPSFAAINSDARVVKYLPGPLSMAESNAMADRIQGHFTRHGFGLWAVELPGVTRFAGFVGLSVPSFTAHFTPCVEVGWRLAPAYWGQGYATEAAGLALSFGFEQAGLDEIVSFTVPNNRASLRVMEKLGMHSVGEGGAQEYFDHPNLPMGHRLRRHLLYRLARTEAKTALS